MKVSCLQFDVHFGDPAANLQAVRGALAEACVKGVDLVITPEAFLTGYVVGNEQDARNLALKGALRAEMLEEGQALAEKYAVHLILGYIEEDPASKHIYNSATLFAPGEKPRTYRKMHLPVLGVDRFATPGEELEVFDTPFGKIGIIICFDLRVPEAARTLALKGADLIVLPTNWPEGAELTPVHFMPVRAAENRVFMAACNRVGTEHGTTFIGHSMIVDPDMKILAEGGKGVEVLEADLDLSEARQKTRVVIPGEYETNTFSTRQPKAYSAT
ncbi:MAG: carbon-nitrogen hydrolase family protein [Armatimonadetes bacterium]|nr:carbon-nitrogen hydrolase family protein [Armatimonadota bacterium]